MELSTRNSQHLSGHQFYTLCANKSFVPIIGWPQMTSEWWHVRTIFVQNKGLKEPLSWMQFLAFSQFLCTKWRRELIGLPNCYLGFSKLWKTKKLFDKFSQKGDFFSFFVIITGIHFIEPFEMKNFSKFGPDILKMADLYDYLLFCIRRCTFRCSVKCS